MRTTSIYDEEGKPKSPACYFLEILSSSTYTLDAKNSIYYSKTAVNKAARKLQETCKEQG